MAVKLKLKKGVLRETLAMALDSVRLHKFRSFLTVLGIVIGVMTAITIASILTGLRQNIIAIIEEYGTNNIYAFHLSTGPRVGEDRSERTRKPLTVADAEAIRTQASGVEEVAHVAPNVGYSGGPFDDNITYQGHNYRWGNTQGVSPNYAGITNIALREGRFISEMDDQQRANVIVIGVNAADALFPGQNQIAGTQVRMGGYNFDIKTADKFIEQFDNITAMVGLIAIAISSLGLLVGGIGVMNIMLVSVTERTKEIGVRKALGARRKDIVRQFLFEAMTLTFLGGILGVLLAVGISKIIMLLVPSLPASIPSWAVIAGLTVSIGVGLIFGVWPARKASRLDPIECLRYE